MKSLSAFVVLALVLSGTFGTMFAVSPVTGADTFTDVPVPVYRSSNVKESLTMSVSDDGRIYISWSERVSGNSDVYFSYSSNNGTTQFAPGARINKNTAGEQRACAITTSNDVLYAVWEDDTKDGGDIMLGRSEDGGLTFSEKHVSQYESGTQSNPSIAVNGNKVAVAWEEYRPDNSIKVWSAAGGFVRNITGHRGAVTDAEFSPDGAYIASGSEDAMVKIWNAGTGALVRNITVHSDKVMAVNWSADGTMLATGSFDHDIAILDTTDFSVITKLNSTNGNPTRNFVNSISFSPDSSRIAAAYNGRFGDETPTGAPSQFYNLTIWNLSDQSSWTRNELNGGHSWNSVTGAAFSHNGTYLASCSKDNTVKIWNSSSGALFKSANLGTDALSLSWSPDGGHIAAGLDNGSVAIVNISDITDIYWFAGSHTGRVNSIDWGVPGNGILTGASDPDAKLWFEEGNPMYGLERMNLTGHTNSVYSADWSSSGLLLLTAGGTSTRYGLGENQVVCAVSSDGGTTFMPPRMVSDSCAQSRLRPKVAVDSAGTVSAVWYDSRNGGPRIYFANSTGSGFNKNVGIDTVSAECATPNIFVDSAGTVHVAWQFGSIPGIRYANSSDGFSQSRVLKTAAQIPHISGTPGGSSLWISWREQNQTTKQYSMRAAVSYNGGTSFPEYVNLTSGIATPDEHTLFVDARNETYVAWETPDWIYQRNTIPGDVWQPHVVSTVPGDGDTDISIFTGFTIRFSEPMDQVSTEAAFSWTDGVSTWLVGDCKNNKASWNAYGDVATFSPRTPLLYQKSGYEVRITTLAEDLAGNTMASEYSFSFTTSVDVDPPQIVFYPGDRAVSYDREYNVSAQITDQWGSVANDSVRLFYQGVGDTSPVNSKKMILTTNNMYFASIPAQQSLGTIYFYIEAADAYNNVARHPVNYTNQSQLHNVSVVDGVMPEISHLRIMETPVFREIEIWSVVTDTIQLQGAFLNFRQIGSTTFINLPMEPDTTPDTFRRVIPAQASIGQVQYNITAIDSSGNFNSTPLYTIQIIDQTAPLINSVSPEYLENQTKVLVRANVTDDVGVHSVTLFFKAVGGNQWVTRAMTGTGGDYYEFTIPAQSRSGVIYFYVNATDTYGNQASTLAAQEQYEIEVVGVGSDYSLYYALGIVLAAMILVLLYLVSRKYRPAPKIGGDTPSDVEPEEATPDKVDESP